MTRQNTSSAVMAQRCEPIGSLDYFPTPPWATRALMEHVIADVRGKYVWEPACGEGHMAGVLAEYLSQVYASDVHDYGIGAAIGSFVGVGPDVAEAPGRPDWIITNPPFNLAVAFAERALHLAGEGVALLVRTAWLEGGDRWHRLFRDCPPTIVAQFAERVPMTKGRWDPDASTATSYCWVVWRRAAECKWDSNSRLVWIPPGCRERLTKPSDRARWAVKSIDANQDMLEVPNA